MEIDVTKVDTSKMDGSDFAGPGSYHFEVLEFMENDPRNGATWFDSEVIAGTVKGAEGKTHREYLNGATLPQFLVATKLLSKQDIDRHQAAGTSPDIDLEGLAIGRQFCGTLEPETYEGKTRVKLSFRMWAVDSSRAKGIPLNKAKLAEFETLLADADQPFDRPEQADNGNGETQPPAGDDIAGDLF